MEKRTLLIPVILLSILFMAAAGSGAILNVPADYPTIQAAVDAAGAGDAVIIAVGTYTGDGNRDIDPNGKAVTIRSTNPDDPDIVAATVIDCNGSSAEPHRGFYFHSGEDADSVVNGLTIINGYAQDGGGIYCFGSSPAIKNCAFADNSAVNYGGAIYNYKGNSAITNCTFTGNAAQRGGAIVIKRSNSAITNCAFSGNLAGELGGAMYNEGGRIINCTFTDNSAYRGGAMYNGGGRIINCTFSDNWAGWKGGAIYNWGGYPRIINCILWGDRPKEIFNDDHFNPVITYSNVQGGWGGEGNINADPLFVDPCNGDYHLLPDSPCIEAGDPDYVAGPNEMDLDGNPRIAGWRIDMGAYEYPALPCISVQEKRITFIKDWPGGLEKTLQIRNCWGGELKWEITEDCPWLAVSPTRGTSSGEVNEVTLIADAGGLSVGEYRCQLTIADDSAINSPVTIDVVLHIGSVVHVPAEYSTIQDAIDAASNWDTVLVADGVYKGKGNRDIDFKGKKIWLKSENGAENCIIDCNGSSAEPHRGFYFHSGEDTDSILDGLTIISGYAKEGGGIYCDRSSPVITNCIFSGNSANRYGGAMFNAGGNSAITKCTFSNNSASSGGAMYSTYSRPTVSNCTFTSNSADWQGGAMYNYYNSNPAITNSTFVSNFGGAICNYYRCNPVITNCSFSGNSTRSSGAIYNYGSNPVMTNCTFSGNLDGAMYNYYNSNPAITNSILWGNGPQEIFNYDYSNVIITYSDVQGGWAGEGNIDIDPLFVDPCNVDYHLYEDSPCIDAGDPNYIPRPNETDLDGNPRIVNDIIDMGAYELQPLTPAELLLDLTDYLDELSLHKGIAGSLQSKLEAALQLLEDDNENNDVAAVNLLEAFINAIKAQYDKKIPAAEADMLIEAAQEIIELLGG